MKRAIRTHLRDFVAMAGLIAIALLVAGYLVQQQGMRVPFLEPEPFRLVAELETGQALTPGQGQTVRVAGVRVGDIEEVALREGRARVTLAFDEEFSDLVREDATLLMRPKTGLKDMFLELNPGTKRAPVARRGFVIPVSNTLPDVNADEVLAGLDGDTRDYLRLLLSGAGTGLKGNGDDLNEVLRRFEPTYRDLAAVTTEVAKRRTELRRLIHSLQQLNTTLGRKDDDLAELVGASSQVFEAIASERRGVSTSVRRLPGALKQASSTLGKVETLANVLRPTAGEVRPALTALRAANARTRPFAVEATPRLREDVRPFVRELRPLVNDLRPAVTKLAQGEPDLTRTFTVLNRFFNMLAFNEDGREGPEKADRDEGYLFYAGWLSHQVNTLFSASDAHGPGRPITYGGTCAILQNTLGAQEELEALLGLTGVLTDPALCGGRSAAGLVPEVPSLPTKGRASVRSRAEGATR